MSERLNRAKELIQTPSESLAVEIKNWIDPEQPSGQAQIVRAALALRNFDGGHLIIGFNDDTRKPEPNAPANIEQLFHIDRIQGLITKHSSEPFEIFIDFPERNGQVFPVLTIPSGVKTPVAVKADLKDNNQHILRQNEIYVRTLHSNNTPSSSKAGWKDWERLVETCFDNREADIGRFLRRHFRNVTPDIFQSFLTNLSTIQPQKTVQERLEQNLKESANRFEQIVSERGANLPPHGSWEIALLLVGDVPSMTLSNEFLQSLKFSNPRYTGWPVWFVSSDVHDPNMHPRVNNNAWEQFVYTESHIDFMVFDPAGYFYQRRALQEDLTGSREPLTVLDFILPVIRTTEAIAVGMSMAKAIGCGSGCTLSFKFRWTNLRGRSLMAMDRMIFFPPKGPAYQDEVVSMVDVPLDISTSALYEYVDKATQPLFAIFSGYSFNKKSLEEWTRKVLERKL